MRENIKSNSFVIDTINDDISRKMLSDVLEINLTAVFINGKKINMIPNCAYIFQPNATITKIDWRTYTILFRNTGIIITYSVEQSLDISLPVLFQYRIEGIYGNFNGNKEDDLQLSSNETCSSASTLSIFLEYQSKCNHNNIIFTINFKLGRVNRTESLFIEPGIYDQDYIPQIQPTFNSSSQNQAAIIACSQVPPDFYQDCLYDYSIVGDNTFVGSSLILLNNIQLSNEIWKEYNNTSTLR